MDSKILKTISKVYVSEQEPGSGFITTGTDETLWFNLEYDELLKYEGEFDMEFTEAPENVYKDLIKLIYQEDWHWG